MSNHKTSKKPSQPRLHWSERITIQITVLALLTLLLYAQTVNYGFVLDDVIVITGNTFVQQGVAGIPDILTHDAFAGNPQYSEAVSLSGGRYRPLSLVMFAIVKQVFGNNAAAMHTLTVLLYIALVVMLFFTLRRLLLESPHHSHYSFLPILPFGATLLFALHPIHTEVVANIKSCDEILALFFTLASLHVFIGYHRTNSPKHSLRPLILSAGLLLLALLSKENAMTFLAVMPLAAYCFTETPLKKNLLTMLPIVFVAALFFVVRSQITNSADALTKALADSNNILNNPFLHASAAEHYATIVAVLGRYMLSAIFPFTMAYEYGYNQIPLVGWANWQPLVSLVLWIAMLTGAVWALRMRYVLAFCALYFVATLSVASNLVFNIGTLMADRFLFMPSVGVALALAWTVIALTNADGNYSSNARKNALVVLVVIGTLYGMRTLVRVPAWKSDYALRVTDVLNAPNSMKVRLSAASVEFQQAMKEQRLTERQRLEQSGYENSQAALAIDPTISAKPYLNLGYYFRALSPRRDSALYYYARALQLMPRVQSINEAYYDVLAEEALEKNLVDSAIACYRKILTVAPTSAFAHTNIGVFLAEKGQTTEAIASFREALRHDPTYPPAQKRFQDLMQKKP